MTVAKSVTVSVAEMVELMATFLAVGLALMLETLWAASLALLTALLLVGVKVHLLVA